jgi:hypothetical protein
MADVRNGSDHGRRPNSSLLRIPSNLGRSQALVLDSGRPRRQGTLIDNPPYRAESLQPTRVLLTQIVAVTSDGVAGPTRVDA